MEEATSVAKLTGEALIENMTDAERARAQRVESVLPTLAGLAAEVDAKGSPRDRNLPLPSSVVFVLARRRNPRLGQLETLGNGRFGRRQKLEVRLWFGSRLWTGRRRRLRNQRGKGIRSRLWL